MISASSHHSHALAVSINSVLRKYISLLADSGAAQIVAKRALVILATDTAKLLVSDPCLEKVHQPIGFTTPMILKAGIAFSIFCSEQGYSLPVLMLIEDESEAILTTMAKKCPSVHTIKYSVMQPSIDGLEILPLSDLNRQKQGLSSMCTSALENPFHQSREGILLYPPCIHFVDGTNDGIGGA